jgi:hypothetical protein
MISRMRRELSSRWLGTYLLAQYGCIFVRWSSRTVATVSVDLATKLIGPDYMVDMPRD